MFYLRGRQRVASVALMLVGLLMGAACQGGRDLDQANKLNQSAGEDVKEIEQIIRENKDKEGEITRAINAEQYDAARKTMDETISAIDRGLEKGKSAAEKLGKAAQLNIDQDIKDYLSLRAQSVNKAIAAFTELRKGVATFRDATGSTDKAAVAKARDDIQQTSQTFDALISETQKLEDKADEIARRHPDKIKPGQ